MLRAFDHHACAEHSHIHARTLLLPRQNDHIYTESAIDVCRWAWNQIEKDEEELGSRPDVVRILAAFNEHVQRTGGIERLIRDCCTGRPNTLSEDDMQALLTVRVRPGGPPVLRTFCSIRRGWQLI